MHGIVTAIVCETQVAAPCTAASQLANDQARRATRRIYHASHRAHLLLHACVHRNQRE